MRELPLGLSDMRLGRDLHERDQQRDERCEDEDQVENESRVVHG